MLVRIIHDCGAAFVLTSKELASHKSIMELLKSSPVPWHCEVDTEILPEEASESEATKLLDKAKPEDIPFLQYTSGSTGTCMTDRVCICYSVVYIRHINRMTMVMYVHIIVVFGLCDII